MDNFANELTETLKFYETQHENHPLFAAAINGELSHKLLQEFAALQYIDSVLWVPMLALMKDRVCNHKLKEALVDNLLCEAGATHTSHITVCLEFIESLGVSPYFGDSSELSSLAKQPIEVMNSVTGLSEPEIAGWILAAEYLVPTLFRKIRPGFARIPGAKLRYLDEHIIVDSDEHAQWMFDSCLELHHAGTKKEEILGGLHLGGRTSLSIPDAIYAKHVRLRRTTQGRIEVRHERLYANLA